MIRTVAIVSWAPDAADRDKAEFLAALAELPAAVGGVRAFSFGEDLRLRDGTADLAVVAEFDTREDFHTYDSHPAHQAIRDRWLGSLVTDARVLQYEL